MVQLFMDGGGFMYPILIIFIIGLGFVLERLYHLIMGLSSNEEFAFKVERSEKTRNYFLKSLKSWRTLEAAHLKNIPIVEKWESGWPESLAGNGIGVDTFLSTTRA